MKEFPTDENQRCGQLREQYPNSSKAVRTVPGETIYEKEARPDKFRTASNPEDVAEQEEVPNDR